MSEEEKKNLARDMEVYAAMVEYMDEQISRIFKWMEQSRNMNQAFAHISDIMPTFLELATASHPSEQKESIPGMMGKSLLPLLIGEKEAIHQNEGIGYELHGMCAYIMDEWKILRLPTPFGKGDWELFNLTEDPSESFDLSDQFPEKRNELILAWEEYGKEVGMIYDPLDMKSILKH